MGATAGIGKEENTDTGRRLQRDSRVSRKGCYYVADMYTRFKIKHSFLGNLRLLRGPNSVAVILIV